MAASKEVIADRLRALREQHRPPQTYRQAANHIDVDERTYGRWARASDPTIPSLDSFEKIAQAYGLDPLDLMGNGDSPFDQRLERIELLLRRLARAQGVDPDESLEDEASRIEAPASADRPARSTGSARRAASS